MERERRFTGDAAHELRTPLTAVKTHIQVARLTALDAATRGSLQQAESGVRRLQHTLEQLLTLARLEELSSFQEDEMIDAQSVARLAVEEIPEEDRHRVKLDDRTAAITSALPKILLLTALRNLLDNALRYSLPDTPVTLRLEAAGDCIRFSVSDRGPGMTEAERDQAKRRFWRKGQGQGSGLGLSIVEVISHRLEGSFTLEPCPGGGTAASMTLPANCLQFAVGS
jgi:two-component system, OmpR family, sensor histidine kinase QseC